MIGKLEEIKAQISQNKPETVDTTPLKEEMGKVKEAIASQKEVLSEIATNTGKVPEMPKTDLQPVIDAIKGIDMPEVKIPTPESYKTILDQIHAKIPDFTIEEIRAAIGMIKPFEIPEWLISKDNRLKVEVDRAGGGGGNAGLDISKLATTANQTNGAQKTKVYLTDENGIESQMLGDTLYPGAPIMIDIDHHEVHCGDSYTATRSVDLTNGASDTIIMNVPNNATKRYHMVITCTTELEADYAIYEGASTVADGTAMTNFNRDRNSANTSTLAITHTPNTPTGGTLIYSDHWGAGRTAGGETRGQQEIILKNNTKYRVVITNSTANNNYVSWKFAHYVHPDA
jgi:hypothetical protein